MANYPKEITVKLRVYEDGKIEVLDKEGKDLAASLKEGKVIKGHNSIGVLVSNPTCLIIGGKEYCW
jgi:hypothetical protein